MSRGPGNRFDQAQSGENGYGLVMNMFNGLAAQVSTLTSTVSELSAKVAVLNTQNEHLEKQLDTLVRGQETQGQRRFQAIFQVVTWVVAIVAIVAGFLR